MIANHVRWLLAELPGLVGSGVLEPDAAERLRRHYVGSGGAAPSARFRTVVLGALGALLIAAGALLVLAHNWEALGRPARAGLAFALLIAGQAVAGFAGWRRPRSIAWGEGAGAFLALAALATFALVGQTYHLGGDLDGLLKVWLLLAAPIPYLLRSSAAASIYAVGAVSWIYQGTWYRGDPVRAGVFVAFAALVVPFAVLLARREPSSLRTAFLLPVLAACGLVALAWLSHATHLPGFWICAYAAALGAIYVAGLRTPNDAADPGWKRPLRALGVAGLAVLTFALGFDAVWPDGPLRGGLPEPGPFSGLAALVILGLAAYAFRGALREWLAGAPHRALLASAPAVAILAWLAARVTGDGLPGMLAANVFGVAVGLAACFRGLRDGSLGLANAGLLLTVAILGARFFDADLDFVVRGIVFMLLGAAFLGVNLWAARRRVREEMR